MTKPLTGPELSEIRRVWSTPSAQRQPLPPALRDRAAGDIARLIASIDAHAGAIFCQTAHIDAILKEHQP